jgi:hypothetical protein
MTGEELWFAWHPVRICGDGPFRWLCPLWRDRSLGFTIYQDREVLCRHKQFLSELETENAEQKSKRAIERESKRKYRERIATSAMQAKRRPMAQPSA